MIARPDKDPGTDWLESALCATLSHAPEFVWLEEPSDADVQQALSVCVGCQVRRECREDTPTTLDEYNEVYEIRGGYALWRLAE